jgi:4-aminobutyrate aminotransferase
MNNIRERGNTGEGCFLVQEKTEEFEKAQGIENPGKNPARKVGQNLDLLEHEAALLDIVCPKAREIIGQDCNIISACAARPYPLVVDSAKGSIIRDVNGREYIDLVAGIAVMNSGYSNLEVKAAISAQLDKMTHCGYGDFFAEPPVKLAKKLKELSGYPKVFYCNSGTEAVEAAIKLAFWKTKRQGLISSAGPYLFL